MAAIATAMAAAINNATDLAAATAVGAVVTIVGQGDAVGQDITIGNTVASLVLTLQEPLQKLLKVVLKLKLLVQIQLRKMTTQLRIAVVKIQSCCQLTLRLTNRLYWFQTERTT